MGIIKPPPVELAKEFTNFTNNDNNITEIAKFDPDVADELTIQDIHFTNTSTEKNITFSMFKQIPSLSPNYIYLIKDLTIQKTDSADRNYLTWNDPIKFSQYTTFLYIQVTKPNPINGNYLHISGSMFEKTL